jgi:hypothetical protein
LLNNPRQDLFGFTDHETGEFLIRLTVSHAQEIFPELLFSVGSCQDLRRCIMGATHVARMTCVAAAVKLRRGFYNEHGCASLPRADGSAKGCIPSADHEDIIPPGEGIIFSARGDCPVE